MWSIEKERKVAKIKIEKFINGEHETSFNVPAFVFGLARTLLPESALYSLAKSGINVRAILEAKDKGVTYTASVDVCERGINKKVVVSLPPSNLMLQRVSG